MEYYHIEERDLGINANIPIRKFASSDEVFNQIACQMVDEIKKNNDKNEKTVFICPVGPVGQYDFFVKMVNDESISLENCWFINMDEYLNDDDTYIDIESKLSFRGFMAKNVYGKIHKELLMSEDQRIFPSPTNPSFILDKIHELGGVDIAFGGIGINGHLAFNEPQEELSIAEFSNLPTRVLSIAKETITANCIGDLNGALEAMPRRCITVGIKEILSAKRIILSVFRPWHQAVVRRAAYGAVTSGFPVTLCQNHPDTVIFVNDIAAKRPF